MMTSKILKLLTLLAGTCCLVNCATISDSRLYWGNYSETLYNSKKNPGKESQMKHKIELMRIQTKSKELALRTPPGVNAELGMICLTENNMTLAMSSFESEKSLYPESTLLMDKILFLVKKDSSKK